MGALMPSDEMNIGTKVRKCLIPCEDSHTRS